MSIAVGFKTLAEAVKQLGEAEVFSCLVVGYKQKIYRKEQNQKNQALLEMAKKDPKFREAVLKAKKSA